MSTLQIGASAGLSEAVALRRAERYLHRALSLVADHPTGGFMDRNFGFVSQRSERISPGMDNALRARLARNAIRKAADLVSEPGFATRIGPEPSLQTAAARLGNPKERALEFSAVRDQVEELRDLFRWF